MEPRLRTALAFVVASLLACYLGWQLAEGSYALPGLVAMAAVATILVRFTGLPADVILTGLLLIGYIVGNRGFAQLTPAPGLPLLPAELGLMVAGGWRAVVCAFERRLPFRRDPLNWAVLAWVVAGSARVLFDSSRGFLALRDFAMIYYAAFFFLVQHMARDAAARRYLFGCLLAGLMGLLPCYALYQAAPDFFLTQLTVSGVPLIYYKGDLVVTFLAIGSVLTFHWAGTRHRLWAWPLAGAMLLFVLAGGNRASILGAIVAAGLLLLARRWRLPAFQGAVAGLALLVLIGLTVVFDHAGASRRLHNLADQAASVLDIAGHRAYQSEDSFNKGDNNRFRLIWWKNVVEETWLGNPLFGLGFGADLAQGFVQEYLPDSTEEFTTRSPHNIFLTVFGRMGAVGLAVWLVFCAVLFAATWRDLRRGDDPAQWSLWCGIWIILCSATFGVVLEGPMGAVVFWSVLGLAGAARPETTAAGTAG